MSVLIEFLVSALIGIYFHWVLKYEEAAYVIFGIGSLLSLATYLVLEEVSHTRNVLLDEYQHAHDITLAFAKIKAPECQIKAQELLTVAKKNLELLQQGFVPLNESELYLESGKALDQTLFQVKAVDPFRLGWDSRGALLNYYEANLRALARGVKITRIFVINRTDLNEATVQKTLQTQIKDGIDVRIAYREDIPSGTGDYSNWSLDFALYDDRVVADRNGEGGGHFGRKSNLSSEVDKYVRLFDLIEHHSYLVTLENEHATTDSAARKSAQPAVT